MPTDTPDLEVNTGQTFEYMYSVYIHRTDQLRGRAKNR
jgi:hypothetical protein